MAYLAIYSRIQVNNESKRVRLIMSTTNSAAKLMNADDRKELALKALKKDKSVWKCNVVGFILLPAQQFSI